RIRGKSGSTTAHSLCRRPSTGSVWQWPGLLTRTMTCRRADWLRPSVENCVRVGLTTWSGLHRRARPTTSVRSLAGSVNTARAARPRAPSEKLLRLPVALPMARKLPPFAALRAFDAAARHCNLRLAGQEACLSVSAISRQVKALEEFLGVELFERMRGNL